MHYGFDFFDVSSPRTTREEDEGSTSSVCGRKVSGDRPIIDRSLSSPLFFDMRNLETTDNNSAGGVYYCTQQATASLRWHPFQTPQNNILGVSMLFSTLPLRGFMLQLAVSGGVQESCRGLVGFIEQLNRCTRRTYDTRSSIISIGSITPVCGVNRFPTSRCVLCA